MTKSWIIWKGLPQLLVIAAFGWVAGAIVMAPTVAMAQEEQGEEEPTREDGLLALREANDAFDAGEYEKAYESYVEAFEILEVAMIKYRMGQSAEQAGFVARAVEHYESYQETGDDEEFLSRIDAALPELRAQLPATVEIVSEPEGAEIYLYAAEEETLLGETPATVELEAGEVAVALRLADHDEEVVRETLEGGQDYNWSVTLEESEATSEPLADGDESADGVDLDIEQPDEATDLTVWGWTATGIGVATLALGGVMTAMQSSVTDEVNSFDRSEEGRGATQEEINALRTELDTKRSDARNYYRAATSSYVAGGVLTAAGVGLLIFQNLRGPSDTELSFDGHIGPQGGYVGFSGRF